MTFTTYNAFSNGDNQHPSKSLASSLTPMQAQLEETRYGWSLQMSPIRAFDALRIWTRLAADAQESHGEEPVSLLFDVGVDSNAGARGRGSTAIESLPDVADRMGIETVDRFNTDVFGSQLVLDELSLRELVGMIDTTRLRSVLVAGPIEQRDGKAMAQAIEAGHSALDVEFRAVASLEVTHDRLAQLHTRQRDHALLLACENFRHYLAAVRQRPVGEITAPQPHQLERLLSLTGSITVRPIETEIYSTSVDVGISTETNEQTLPADHSLIYDIPSDTWHDEA